MRRKPLVGIVFAHAAALTACQGIDVTADEGSSRDGGADVVIGGAWSQVTSSLPGPSPRFSPAMAYDPIRQRTVLFGGYTGETYVQSNILTDTWEWDGTTWTQVTPSNSPPAAGTMTYDPVRGHLIELETAQTDPSSPGQGVYAQDLWQWDGTNWEHVGGSPVAAPVWYGMTYDSMRATAVVFDTNVLDDPTKETWEWNDESWSNLMPTLVPSARRDSAIAFDVSRGRTVLFGGWEQSLNATGMVSFSDVWEWDGMTWTNPTPAVTPPARSSDQIVYDTALQRTLVFAGSGTETVADANTGEWSLLNDLWAWDGARWTAIEPSGDVPPGLCNFGMAYDSVRDRVVVFGGQENHGVYTNDTWELTPPASL
jgi:hypothetical protein